MGFAVAATTVAPLPVAAATKHKSTHKAKGKKSSEHVTLAGSIVGALTDSSDLTCDKTGTPPNLYVNLGGSVSGYQLTFQLEAYGYSAPETITPGASKGAAQLVGSHGAGASQRIEGGLSSGSFTMTTPTTGSIDAQYMAVSGSTTLTGTVQGKWSCDRLTAP